MSTEDERAAGADPTPAVSAQRATAPAAPDAATSVGASVVAGVLAEIEARPLAERAEGYHALAERLRTQLEHSDPSMRT